jgi:hypothetical protein
MMTIDKSIVRCFDFIFYSSRLNLADSLILSIWQRLQ